MRQNNDNHLEPHYPALAQPGPGIQPESDLPESFFPDTIAMGTLSTENLTFGEKLFTNLMKDQSFSTHDLEF
jgi:hypothetical protein